MSRKIESRNDWENCFRWDKGLILGVLLLTVFLKHPVYWGYLWSILTISLPYILGLSHFLNTFNTLSQLVHHTCTTIPKQVLWIICIHAYIPSLHLCTSIPPPFPHSAIALVVLQYARPKGVIFPPFHSNFDIFASTQTFKQTENIFYE